MQIKKIHIKGFRNFNDTEIFFQKKTLIFGANDVGKTNLIYVLRLLFDKAISDHELELSDSDFNAYSGTNLIEITATISDITEECLLSFFSGSIKDGNLVIRYSKNRNESFKLFSGYDESMLSEIPSRQYIKRLNMQYVDTNRNLSSFLGRERAKILQISKEKLTDKQREQDDKQVEEIQSSLNSINSKIGSLNYVSTSLEKVNKELSDLSISNEDQSVCFVAGESDAEKLLDNLVLSSSTGENPLAVGGDGRNNQIYIATWIAKQNIQRNIDHVTFYAIEEPESHLHPHQQRKLSSYIQNSFNDQVFITSHSPHIASQFEASSLVRLYSINKFSYAACSGCSNILKDVFNQFGYRLNILSAETFFSNGVFLVEGTSEVLFYTALAEALKIDLDRLNISILSVEGIGFKPYVALCDALNIPWVLRTDNDIFQKSENKSTRKYYAGISRIAGIIESCKITDDGLLQYWNDNSANNEWNSDDNIPKCALDLNIYISEKALKLGIFLSEKDLENDLANSPLKDELLKHYKKNSSDELVIAMQNKKAENMFTFTKEKKECLSLLKDNKIASPLTTLKSIIEKRNVK